MVVLAECCGLCCDNPALRICIQLGPIEPNDIHNTNTIDYKLYPVPLWCCIKFRLCHSRSMLGLTVCMLGSQRLGQRGRRRASRVGYTLLGESVWVIIVRIATVRVVVKKCGAGLLLRARCSTRSNTGNSVRYNT